MTWDVNRIKRQQTQRASSTGTETGGLTSSALEGTPDDGLNPLASLLLSQAVLDEPADMNAPSYLERKKWHDFGLLHPSELDKIRQAMTRGLYETEGHITAAQDKWPIDEDDNQEET
jgi:hypothetical protein